MDHSRRPDCYDSICMGMCIRDVGKFGWWDVFCPLLLATSSLPLTLSGITEKEKQNNKKEPIKTQKRKIQRRPYSS